MRKIGLVIISLVLILFSFACNSVDLESIASKIEIGYQEGDNKDKVTENLLLSKDSIDRASVSWYSNNVAITIDDNLGIVTRGPIDIEVTLTVIVSLNNQEAKNTYQVIVKALEKVEPDINLEEMIETIEIVFAKGDNKESVTKNVTLLTELANDISITWISDKSTIVIDNNQGIVNQEPDDVLVTLTLILTLDQKTASKNYQLVVKARKLTLEEIVAQSDILYRDSDNKDNVTKNLILPIDTVNGVEMIWTSNNQAITINGNQGVVNRELDDVLVTLTLTATLNGESESKQFKVMVKAREKTLEEIISSVEIVYQTGDNKDNVTKDLFLSKEELFDAQITWSSSNYSVQIEEEIGYVIRSLNDKKVELTATATKDGVFVNKVFILTVIAKELTIISQNAKLSYTGETTNMTVGNNASIVNLDPQLFNVTSTKAGSNYAGLNKDGTIRLYQPSGGVTLEVGINNKYKITSVEFIFGNIIADAQIKLDEQVVYLTANQLGNKQTFINLDILSFSIQNKNSSNTQIHIKEIIINYEALEPDNNSLPELSEIDQDVYSVLVGDNFSLPIVSATDFFNQKLVVFVDTNLDLQTPGEYEVTYSATNEIGTTYQVISVHVFPADTILNIELNIDGEIPETILTYVEYEVPDATAYDFLGTPLTVIKSAETLLFKFTGFQKVWYYTIDIYGNELYVEFIIEVLVNPDYVGPEPGDYMPYYEGIEDLTGDSLKNNLRIIISAMTLLNYNNTSIPLSSIDEDLNDTGKVYLIYSGAKVNATWDGGATWNKEHVWAKSLFGLANMKNNHKGIGSDMHNLRAANPSVNSSRGNKIFLMSSGSYGAVGVGWYPGDDHIGDVARIILYMHVAWGIEINVGQLNTFLVWHQMDEVDDFEIARNDKIYQYQNNRNPFIDHPDLVELIWGIPSNNENILGNNFIPNLVTTFPGEYYNFIIAIVSQTAEPRKKNYRRDN